MARPRRCSTPSRSRHGPRWFPVLRHQRRAGQPHGGRERGRAGRGEYRGAHAPPSSPIRVGGAARTATSRSPCRTGPQLAPGRPSHLLPAGPGGIVEGSLGGRIRAENSRNAFPPDVGPALGYRLCSMRLSAGPAAGMGADHPAARALALESRHMPTGNLDGGSDVVGVRVPDSEQ